MPPLSSEAAAALALTLVLALLAAAACAWRRCWSACYAGVDSDSSSDEDEDEDDRLAAEALGDAREETIALIAEQRRRRRQLRRRRAALSSDGGTGVLASLRALFSSGGAVGSDADSRRQRRPSFSSFRLKKSERVPVPPKRVHQPHFFPLLQETAQWWEAQCVAAAVVSPEPVPPAPIAASEATTNTEANAKELLVV